MTSNSDNTIPNSTPSLCLSAWTFPAACFILLQFKIYQLARFKDLSGLEEELSNHKLDFGGKNTHLIFSVSRKPQKRWNMRDMMVRRWMRSCCLGLGFIQLMKSLQGFILEGRSNKGLSPLNSSGSLTSTNMIHGIFQVRKHFLFSIYFRNFVWGLLVLADEMKMMIYSFILSNPFSWFSDLYVCVSFFVLVF